MVLVYVVWKRIVDYWMLFFYDIIMIMKLEKVLLVAFWFGKQVISIWFVAVCYVDLVKGKVNKLIILKNTCFWAC